MKALSFELIKHPFMKNIRIAQVFFLLICTASYSIASAQDGYVVTIKGDTIKGKIKYLNYKTSSSVQVQTGDKKITYSILQTRAFSLNNEVYHPVRTAQGYFYMKLLKEGYLSLYAYQPENQSAWDGRFLIKKDGEGRDVPNLSFKKQMQQYLADCRQVVNKIESNELSKNKINEIVDAYNECIEARSQSIVVEADAAKKQAELTTSWTELENALQNGNNFEGRSDALDMIKEIKSKVQKNEKVPNFLTDGLKSSLSQHPDYKELLDKALSELK